jgi:hypothetical protein
MAIRGRHLARQMSTLDTAEVTAGSRSHLANARAAAEIQSTGGPATVERARALIEDWDHLSDPLLRAREVSLTG